MQLRSNDRFLLVLLASAIGESAAWEGINRKRDRRKSVPPLDPVRGADLLDPRMAPLSTSGRWVVDRLNQRVKFACVNWHGLEQKYGVPGGLTERSIDEIAGRIRDLGFNCVRIPLSIYSILRNPRVNNSYISRALNPDLMDLTWHEMFDKTIDALSNANLMVILDRHMILPGNNPSNVSLQAGLWYGLGFSSEDNVRALEMVAERTKDQPFVVAFDIINEPHDWDGVMLTWGDGNEKSDLHRYFETAGNAVLDKNPNLLIIAEGMCCGKIMAYLKDGPQIKLKKEGRLVHSPHSYVFFSLTGVISTNAGGIKYLNWVSWPNIAWWCGVIEVFIVAPSIGISLLIWRRLGMPRIPKRLWVRTLAAWLAILTLILSVTFLLMFHSMKYGVGYCSYQADTVFWPFFVSNALFTTLLVAITVSTFYIPANWYTFVLGGKDARGLVAIPGSQSDQLVEDISAGTQRPTGYNLINVESDCGEGATAVDAAPPSYRGDVSELAKYVVTHWFANVVAASNSLFVAIALIGVASAYFSTQQYFDDLNDYNFGFLLQENNPYTAPVFIGEFGTSQDSEYFQHVVSYMASRDLDWAYWPLNPVRPRGGWIQPDGEVNLGDDPDEMIEDSWSFLKKDWVSVRQAWMYQRLMRIMRWPSIQTGYTIPCNRLVTAECGG